MRIFLLKRLFLFLLFSCSTGLLAWAGGGPLPLGGRAWGVAGASLAFADGWALWNNAGALGGVRNRQVVVAYDLRFGMKGLQTMAAGYVQPLRKGVFGASVGRFGDELYSENTLGVAYSRGWDNVTLGMKANYMAVAMSEVGVRHCATLEIGGTARLLPELTLGFHAYNITRSRLDQNTGERLPTVLRLGVSYKPLEKIVLNAETEKDILFPASLRLGVEYEAVRNLRLRTGFASRPQTVTFGIGFSPKRLQLDYAVRTHPVLGLSHHVSIGWSLNRRKKDTEIESRN